MPVDYGGRYYRPRQPGPTTGTTTPTSLDDAADEILGGLGGGASGVPQPIGVNVGYRAAAPAHLSPHYYPHGFSYTKRDIGPVARSSSRQANISPRYYADMEYAPANFTSNVIRDLQSKLAFVGLYDPNANVISGDWGEETASAFRRLLAYANQHGMTWQTALGHLRSQVEGSGQAGGKMTIDEFGNIVSAEEAAGPTRAPLVTRTTDPRTLELVLRETSMNLLGQALSPDQVQMMTKAFNDMEVQRQQEAYDKQLTGGSVVDIPSPEAYAQAEVEAKNPQGVANYRGLQYMNEAMQLLASPAWGIG